LHARSRQCQSGSCQRATACFRVDTLGAGCRRFRVALDAIHGDFACVDDYAPRAKRKLEPRKRRLTASHAQRDVAYRQGGHTKILRARKKAVAEGGPCPGMFLGNSCESRKFPSSIRPQVQGLCSRFCCKECMTGGSMSEGEAESQIVEGKRKGQSRPGVRGRGSTLFFKKRRVYCRGGIGPGYATCLQIAVSEDEGE